MFIISRISLTLHSWPLTSDLSSADSLKQNYKIFQSFLLFCLVAAQTLLSQCSAAWWRMLGRFPLRGQSAGDLRDPRGQPARVLIWVLRTHVISQKRISAPLLSAGSSLKSRTGARLSPAVLDDPIGSQGWKEPCRCFSFICNLKCFTHSQA